MIDLKTQLPILNLDALKTFLGQQTERRARVTSAVEAATAAVAKARDSVIIPTIGETKRVGNVDVLVRTGEDEKLARQVRSHAQRQVVKAISDIGANLDKEVVPIVKQMNVASDTAREMSTRHWDIYSVLRRSKGTSSNFMEATQLRAFYAEILEDIEPRELAAFAQQAIDQGDPVLADAVLRENFKQPRDRRSFQNVALLDKLPNAEHDAAQSLLASVTTLYEQAVLQYAQFGRENGTVSLQRMTFGLKAHQLEQNGGVDPQEEE